MSCERRGHRSASHLVCAHSRPAGRVTYPRRDGTGLPDSRQSLCGSHCGLFGSSLVFYRNPTCVPNGFNLFDFYDIPGAFVSAPTVDGFSLHTEPMGMTPPKISQLNGDEVPIWFVPWASQFQDAVSSGVLTMAQLEAMDGLVKGIATNYKEHLTSVENHPKPTINITARGCIIGGGSFRYDVNWSGLTVADVKNVKIVID